MALPAEAEHRIMLTAAVGPHCNWRRPQARVTRGDAGCGWVTTLQSHAAVDDPRRMRAPRLGSLRVRYVRMYSAHAAGRQDVRW